MIQGAIVPVSCYEAANRYRFRRGLLIANRVVSQRRPIEEPTKFAEFPGNSPSPFLQILIADLKHDRYFLGDMIRPLSQYTVCEFWQYANG
jgi:hypothetical protein